MTIYEMLLFFRCCYFSGYWYECDINRGGDVVCSFHAPTVCTSWTSILDHCDEKGRALVKMSKEKVGHLENDDEHTCSMRE